MTHQTPTSQAANTATTKNSLPVRKLAAKVAVEASKKSGRPVHPHVAELAND